jgi:hypothetical protein
LDLGFGCGDQTLELLALSTKTGYESNHKLLASTSTSAKSKPLIEHYVGITINPTQFTYAHARLTNPNYYPTRFKIYLADAAKPSTWPDELYAQQQTGMLQGLYSPESRREEYWILALDTMYHFKPSRKTILKYAYEYLHASVMAFDLLLSSEAKWWERLLLMILTKTMDCPMNTFLTEPKYLQMLVEAGYKAEDVEMRDISSHCFSPLAEFLGRRERELAVMGLGLGKLSVARWIFGWWGRSGVVRGMIIVARRQGGVA